MTLYPIPNVPDALAREIYAALLRSLPPPHDGTQEARDARDARAMAAIAALIPENAAEAELAVDAVATDFHAKHALAAASHPNLPIEALKNCRTMVASMLRQSHATIRTLRQLQIDRRKLEDARYPAAMERAGYYFKDVSVMESPPEPPEQPHAPVFADMDEAEQYAARYPRRVAAIRASGGVPPNCDFFPPEPEIIAAIIASTSPIVTNCYDPTLPLPSREGAGGGGAASPPTQNPTAHTLPLPSREGAGGGGATSPATQNPTAHTLPLPLREGAGGGGATSSTTNPTASDNISPNKLLRRA